MNMNKLRGKMAEAGMSVSDLAIKIGVTPSTLYRKMSNGGDTILIKDANAITNALSLTAEDAMVIFFS